MKRRITDKNFKYVPAIDTDIRKTFERLRREQREKSERAADNVMPMPKKAKK